MVFLTLFTGLPIGALERLKAWDEAVLRERARSDKHTVRVLLPNPVTSEEARLHLHSGAEGLAAGGDLALVADHLRHSSLDTAQG